MSKLNPIEYLFFSGSNFSWGGWDDGGSDPDYVGGVLLASLPIITALEGALIFGSKLIAPADGVPIGLVVVCLIAIFAAMHIFFAKRRRYDAIERKVERLGDGARRWVASMAWAYCLIGIGALVLAVMYAKGILPLLAF